MKAPIVALAATAAGFAAASVYLYGELGVERVQTQAEVAARSKHEARSRELHDGVVLSDSSDASDTSASMLPFSQVRASNYVLPAAESTVPTLSASGIDSEQSAPPEIDSTAPRSASIAPTSTESQSTGSASFTPAQPADTGGVVPVAVGNAQSTDTSAREERAATARSSRRLMRERARPDSTDGR